METSELGNTIPHGDRLELGYISGEEERVLRRLSDSEIEKLDLFDRYIEDTPPLIVDGVPVGLPLPPRDYYYIQKCSIGKDPEIVCLFDGYCELLPGQRFEKPELNAEWERFLKRLVKRAEGNGIR